MTFLPLITVFGATGSQGGSVTRSLLQNPSFRVRAITRNPDSEASKQLALLGADVHRANGFNSDEMLAAFAGSWGAFANINSDDKAFASEDGPTEFDMGKTIVDAAAKAGVKHFVFSSGPNCTVMTGGKIRIKAMDMKFKIEQYARGLGQFQTVIGIGAGWFFENFLDKDAARVFGGFPHHPNAEGFLTFHVPYWGGDEDVPFLSITHDFGDIVQGIFLDPKPWDGQFIHAVSDICSFDKIVGDFEKATGKKSRFNPVLPSWEALETHGIHELQDVKLMFGATQVTGGLYFGVKTESKRAAQLKHATAAALGRPRTQASLISAQDWFREKF